MKNIDNVILNNLQPNENDLVGWEDKTTKKNYWLLEEHDFLQVAPMIPEKIIEIRPMPLREERIATNAAYIDEWGKKGFPDVLGKYAAFARRQKYRSLKKCFPTLLRFSRFLR